MMTMIMMIIMMMVMMIMMMMVMMMALTTMEDNASCNTDRDTDHPVIEKQEAAALGAAHLEDRGDDGDGDGNDGGDGDAADDDDDHKTVDYDYSADLAQAVELEPLDVVLSQQHPGTLSLADLTAHGSQLRRRREMRRRVMVIMSKTTMMKIMMM